MLCGQAFASIMYVTYYTSKLDKASDVKDVIKKLKYIGADDSTSKGLQKVLLGFDTCRATGAPEAVSNLLCYPHRVVSSHIIRIDTRCYLEINDDNNQSIQSINNLFSDIVKENDDFQLTKNQNFSKQNTSSPQQNFKIDKVIQEYFDRPVFVYNSKKHENICTKDMSMVEYIENFETTRKRKLCVEDSTNKKGKIVRARKSENDVILDLKYRVSPPDTSNEKWCAGALSLYVPHDSIENLLTVSGEKVTLTKAYSYYSKKTITNKNGIAELQYPKLSSHQEIENNIHHVTSHQRKTHSIEDNIGNKVINPGENISSSQDVRSGIDDEDDPTDSFLDLHPEMFFGHELNAFTKHSSLNILSWNGKFSTILARSNNPLDCIGNYTSLLESDNIDTVSPECSSLNEHKRFITEIIEGKCKEKENAMDKEILDVLKEHSGDRKKSSLYYLKRIILQAKTLAQKYAIYLIAYLIECYFFQDSDRLKSILSEREIELISDRVPSFLPETPAIVSIIGVPWAGKSWVVSKLRVYCGIRLDKNDFPAHSREHELLNLGTHSSIINAVKECVFLKQDGNYGRTAAICLSGAAAGIIGEFTIHSSLHIPVTLKREIRSEELPLPPLSQKKREELLSKWSGVKVLIIDEAYTLQIDTISIIDERLKQIFESKEPFGGLVAIMVGDPRQIIPVQGKPLYDIGYYMNLDKEKNCYKFNDYGEKFLTVREQKGYKIYASSLYHAPLNTSVRLQDDTFSKVNMKIATYSVDEATVNYINSFEKSKDELYNEPWISDTRLFSTWKEVNDHIKIATMINAKCKGIFRAWTPVFPGTKIRNEANENSLKKGIEIFYTSDDSIKAEYTCPLPYIDFYLGQIICLKQNWNPLFGLYNNAKAIVVGLIFKNENIREKPLMDVKEATEICFKDPESLKFDLLVKPFMPFHGPSAASDVSGILCVPWVSVSKKINGIQFSIEGPKIFPANAFTQHQSQGGTFYRSVAVINKNCNKYGMANVVTSRTPSSSNFAMAEMVSKEMLSPCPENSKRVEPEYKR